MALCDTLPRQGGAGQGALSERLTCVHLQRLGVHEHQGPVHRARSIHVRLAVPCSRTAAEW